MKETLRPLTSTLLISMAPFLETSCAFTLNTVTPLTLTLTATPELAAPPVLVGPTREDKAPDKSTSRTPTSGAEVKRGDARADTGAAPIPFGGLSTGGGGTGGVQINVGDFCCPEYIAVMNQRITEHWNKNQGTAGTAVMKFTIQRDGTMTAIEIEQSSRNPVLDLESRRALITTRQLPPLPPAFTRPTLTVFLSFEYKR